MPKVTIIKAVLHGEKTHKPGTELSVSEKDADLMISKGFAKLSEKKVGKDPTFQDIKKLLATFEANKTAYETTAQQRQKLESKIRELIGYHSRDNDLMTAIDVSLAERRNSPLGPYQRELVTEGKSTFESLNTKAKKLWDAFKESEEALADGCSEAGSSLIARLSREREQIIATIQECLRPYFRDADKVRELACYSDAAMSLQYRLDAYSRTTVVGKAHTILADSNE